MSEGPSAEREARPIWPAIRAGLLGRCPRCGKGRLFAGFLETGKSCPACGLDYGFVDAGDGPAVFVIMIAGFLIVGAALWVEFTWHPPLWLHALIWIPVTLGVCIGLLRPLKGVLVALQYHHRAEQGRIEGM